MKFFSKGEYEDPESCFALLHSSVKNSKAEGCLLSILQHLLLITDDFVVRLVKYFVFLMFKIKPL